MTRKVRKFERGSRIKALVAITGACLMTALLVLVFITEVNFTVPAMGATPSVALVSTVPSAAADIAQLRISQEALERRVTAEAEARNAEQTKQIVRDVFAGIDVRLDRITAALGRWWTVMRIENLAATVSDLKQLVSLLQKDMNLAAKERGRIEADLGQAKASIVTLQGQQETLTSELQSHPTKAAVTAEISAAVASRPTKAEVEALIAAAVDPLSGRVGNVETESRKHGTSIDKLIADVAGLLTRPVPKIAPVAPAPVYVVPQSGCQTDVYGRPLFCPKQK